MEQQRADGTVSETLSVDDASPRILELVERASAGETFALTENGVEVARLVPPDPEDVGLAPA
ncbi:MAG TPA: type II toxin-antitoxin system prevent-host-death family antitoxin [Tepidisphaeraceae bacterium]|nr:type II toxin-antitoxin system prevent-host-death family antitoxin [Tepidisphaeraceae bacterium]